MCGWAAQGIPFKIACQGIDRYFVRYYAKGPQRRPVQIDFCEADVLDAFDDWRRAVGVRMPGAIPGPEESAKQQRRSLREHLNRVLERLTTILAGPTSLSEPVRQLLESTANEVSTLSDLPSPIRGEARSRVSARLADLDREMLVAVRQHGDPALLAALRQEAVDELAPFRERMPSDAFQQAVESAVDRLLRDSAQLPSIHFD